MLKKESAELALLRPYLLVSALVRSFLPFAFYLFVFFPLANSIILVAWWSRQTSLAFIFLGPPLQIVFIP
jgi:membrane-anchored protein YejM (alkaline phosphatase superfamily)